MTGHVGVAKTQRQVDDSPFGVVHVGGVEGVKGTKSLPHRLGAGVKVFGGLFMENRDIV